MNLNSSAASGKNFFSSWLKRYASEVKRPLLPFILLYIAVIAVIVWSGPRGAVSRRIYHIPKDRVDSVSDTLVLVRKTKWKAKGQWLTVRFLSGDLKGFQAEGYSRADARPGDVLRISGGLSLPKPAQNPGGFDALAYYAAQGSSYLMDLSHQQFAGRRRSLISVSADLKLRMERLIFQAVPEGEAGMICAILLGDRDYLPEEWNETFRSSGMAHIFAISGLHIQTFFGLCGLLADKLLGKRRGGALSVVLVWSYVILTGCSVSAVRAAIFQTVHSVGPLVYKEEDPVMSISLAAFILLLIQPVYIRDAGFLLSFSAVLGLRYIAPILGRLYFLPKPLRDIAAPSFAVTLAGAPITVYYYHLLNVYSPILNLLVIPLMSVLFPTCILGVLLSFISPVLGKPLLYAVYFLLKLYEGAGKAATMLPGAALTPAAFPTLKMVCYYGLLTVSVWFFRKHKEERKRLLAKALPCAVLCLIVLVFPQNRLPEVTFLNVGQGDCAYVCWHGKHYLVDAGPEYEYTIKPFLLSKGIRRLDGVFLSHFDADHSEGLAQMLAEDVIQVKRIYMPDHPLHDCPGRGELEILAEKAGTDMVYWQSGNRIDKGKDTVLCLSPVKNEKYLSENDASMVLWWKIGGTVFLFTGDLETEGEEKLLRRMPSLSGDVLKCGHHGSATSSSDRFLRTISPRFAAISSKKSVYGHPHEATLMRLSDLRIPYFVTEEKGALIFRIRPGYLKLFCFASGEVNYARTS